MWEEPEPVKRDGMQKYDDIPPSNVTNAMKRNRSSQIRCVKWTQEHSEVRNKRELQKKLIQRNAVRTDTYRFCDIFERHCDATSTSSLSMDSLVDVSSQTAAPTQQKKSCVCTINHIRSAVTWNHSSKISSKFCWRRNSALHKLHWNGDGSGKSFGVENQQLCRTPTVALISMFHLEMTRDAWWSETKLCGQSLVDYVMRRWAGLAEAASDSARSRHGQDCEWF